MANEIDSIIAWLSLPSVQEILLAVGAIFAGIVAAKLLAKLIMNLHERFMIGNTRAMHSIAKLTEVLVFIFSLIVALHILHLGAASIIVATVLSLVPKFISLALLLVLGFVVINVCFEILKSALMRVGLSEYLDDVGISRVYLDNAFLIAKVFLFLIVVSASLNFVGLSFPFVDILLQALIYGFVLFSVAVSYYIFRDSLANFFGGIYIEKNVLKRGQFVRVGNIAGEVISIGQHGTTIKMSSGYDVVIPNKELMQQRILVRRTKQDIFKLEQLRAKFVAQLASHCGPASAQMLLNFFGYEVPQETIAKKANTKVPGGTGPKKLIKAIEKLTSDNVRGLLVKYDQIINLRDEVKSWLSEGALILMWFNKAILFKHSKTRGHYVLCVGVEENELIIMDPSKATGGVYMVDYSVLQEAMSEHDKPRGYLLFAKRGTPAYWRVVQNLPYTNISAYSELSKSFERYLKKLLHKNQAISHLLSEHVFSALGEKPSITRLWKPKKKVLSDFKGSEPAPAI